MVKLVPDYRPLATSQQTVAHPEQTSVQGRVLKRKRPHTKVACNNCRERKWACDGDRPQCHSCRKKGIDCVYTSINRSETHIGILKRENDVLRQQSERLEELLSLLKVAPSDVVETALAKLRQDDPGSAVNFLKAAFPSTRNLLSEQTTACGYLPSVRSEQELHLISQYPAAYPILGEGASSPAAWQDYRPASLPSSGSPSPSPPPMVDRQMIHDNNNLPGPSPVPQPIDPRLHGLNITPWTNVNVTNKLAAGAISFYLDTTHPIVRLFDADLFINSLKSHSTEFCSSFCVNSLLAFTCQGYTAKDPSATIKSYEFEREADKIFKSEQIPDSLPNMAGLILLWLSHLLHGSGTDGKPCVLAGSQMAQRLRLYGVPNSLTATELGSGAHLSAASQTAWGCYSASTVQSLYTTPVFTHYPPLLPIPGDTETDQTFTAQEKVDAFPSLCKLYVIVQGIFGKRHPADTSDEALKFTLSEYSKLLALSNELPRNMLNLPGAPYHVFIFHIYYHTITLEIFRPFVSDQRQSSWCLPETLPAPQVIFAASIKQLKRLILTCSSYPETAWDIFWQVSMISVVNVIIKERDPEWRLYFFLCLHHFKVLSRCFHQIAWIIPGLLAMGIQYGTISKSEAQFIREGFERDQKAQLPQGSGAGFILDMDEAVKDWNAAQADSLAAKFEEIKLFDEFTTGII